MCCALTLASRSGVASDESAVEETEAASCRRSHADAVVASEGLAVADASAFAFASAAAAAASFQENKTVIITEAINGDQTGR